MNEKRKGFNERKLLLEIKEFKKKIHIYDLTKKIEEKQKDVHKEIKNVSDQRLEKLRHNALTNSHLSSYIADLNFKLYSLPEKDKLVEENEIKLMQLYADIISLLEKYQNLKSDIYLTDKKELEDKIVEQALEEQKKELSYLSRQEKYEKYIYDKLLLAQNDLVDICNKYRTQVHLCEEYERNLLKLKTELDICKDTNKKLTGIVNRLKIIEKKLKNKMEKMAKKDNIKIFEPILISKNTDNIIGNKTIDINKNNFYKINVNRPKSNIRLNKNKSSLVLDTNFKNIKTNNKLKLTTTNHFYKLGTIQINSRANIHKFFHNKNRVNFRRTFNRKKSFQSNEQTTKLRNISSNTTNYLTKTRNKSNNDIKLSTSIKNKDDIYEKNYLNIISQFLTENIDKIREEIKLKMKLKAEEIRSRCQIKYIISKIIEDIDVDVEESKKEKTYDINNYYDNLLGIQQNQEIKQLENMIFEKKLENSGQQLYVLTYILDNCFNGINNIKSIFPETMLKYINIDE